MKDSSLDTLSYISKATIVIPLLLLIIGIISIGYRKIKTARQDNPSKTQVSPSPVKTATIDLTGPLVCTLKIPKDQTGKEDLDIKASVKDKKIYAEVIKKNEIDYLLYRNDCLYMWENTGIQGVKFCQVSNFLTLFNVYKSLGNKLPVGEVEKIVHEGNLNKYCKREEVKDIKIFEIPKNIRFQSQ